MAAVSDQNIHDLASFKAVTSDSRAIAGLYFYLVMDCLVDLAYNVSCDFFKRPHYYTHLGQAPITDGDTKGTDNALPRIIAELHARYGSNEFFPSMEQRGEIYLPIFGRSDDQSTAEESNFAHLRDALIQAATAFAERSVDTGIEMLRVGVRDAHRPFRDYLNGLRGDSVTWSSGSALSRLTEESSYTILRNRGVASVFGVVSPPGANWPYVSDPNGDKLVDALSKQLTPDEMRITRERFSNLLKTALKGAEAIATAIDFDTEAAQPDPSIDLLITRCYTWGTALMSLGGPAPKQSAAATKSNRAGKSAIYQSATYQGYRI